MASRGTCDWKGLPWPCPIAAHFAIEAEAQKGQVTCLRPHSLALSFQSRRSLCFRTKTVTPPPPLLVFTVSWHLASVISLRLGAAPGREAVASFPFLR